MFIASSSSMSSRRQTLQWSHRLLQNNFYKYNNNDNYSNHSSGNTSSSNTNTHGNNVMHLNNASALNHYSSSSALKSLSSPFVRQSSFSPFQQQGQQTRQFHANVVAMRTKPRKHAFKLARWLRKTGTRRYKAKSRVMSKQNRYSLLYKMLREQGVPLQDISQELSPAQRPDDKPKLRQVFGVPVIPKDDPTVVTPEDDFMIELSDMRALGRVKRELDEKASASGEQAEATQGQFIELNAEGEFPVMDIPLEENKLWSYLQDELKRDDIEAMDESKLLERFSFDEYIGVMKHRHNHLEEIMDNKDIRPEEAKELAITARLAKEKMRMAFIRRLKPIEADSAPKTENTFIQWVNANKHLSLSEFDDIPYHELVRTFKLEDVIDSARYLSDDDAYDLFHVLKPVLAEVQHDINVLPDVLHEEHPDEELLDMVDFVKGEYAKSFEEDGEAWDREADEDFYNVLGAIHSLEIDALGSREKLTKRKEEAKTAHPTAPMREKMWQLHLENPHYWTGERLGRAFGIDRDEAWLLMISRETREAAERGLPFNRNKMNMIFGKSIRDNQNAKYFENNPSNLKKKRRLIKKNKAPYGHTMNEEDAYKYFLEETEKALPSGGGDDLLPDWAKLPFQKPNITEDKVNEPLKILPTMPSEAKLGSDLPRSPISFIEASSKDIPPSERKLMVKQVDGVLREMSMLEKELAYRKGTIRRTRMGLGGKAKRKKAMRQRRF